MENCFKSGLVNELEWKLYCDWHTHLLGALGGLAIDGFVYLRAQPEVNFLKQLTISDKCNPIREGNLPCTVILV